MQIDRIEIAKLKIPLIRPFITALRRTEYVEDIVVILYANNGLVAYGSAASTPVITGDSQESIIGGLQLLAHKLLGADLSNTEEILRMINSGLVNNNSAKAAMDIAIHDLLAQQMKVPLYQLLGGGNPRIKTLTTVSVKTVDEMVKDAQLFVDLGFETLKIKVGLNPIDDIERIKAIRAAVGHKINIVSDANQGWDAKSALNIIDELVDSGLDIAMVEQPVKAWDYANLKFIRDNSRLPIYADESVFGIRDAVKVITEQCADGINIKLMKSGGIYSARTIYDLATNHATPCMAGCMLESPIGLAAMASFVVGRSNIKFVDLDPITMIKSNPVSGGIILDGADLILSSKPGLGIEHINGLESVTEVSLKG